MPLRSGAFRASVILAGCALGTAAAVPAMAQDMVYQPVDPSFGGNPFNSAHLLGIANAQNDYNTYRRRGLPEGPIANPGKASIEAVLHPAQTKALYFVADGTGGHVFANTLAEQNANVARWYAIRRQRGQM